MPGGYGEAGSAEQHRRRQGQQGQWLGSEGRCVGQKTCVCMCAVSGSAVAYKESREV